MKAQLVVGLALVLLEAFAFSYFTRSTLFPILAALIVISASLPRFPVQIDPRREVPLAIGLAAYFLIEAQILPDEPNSIRPFVADPYVYAIAKFFLALQALQFLIRRDNGRLPQTLPLNGVLVMIGIADRTTSDWDSHFYQICAFGFAALTA